MRSSRTDFGEAGGRLSRVLFATSVLAAAGALAAGAIKQSLPLAVVGATALYLGLRGRVPVIAMGCRRAPGHGIEGAGMVNSDFDIELLLSRSTDAVAALADLLAHREEHPELAALTAMLENAGLGEWGADRPRAHARRLSYSGGWYFIPIDDEIGSASLTKLLEVEAALNISELTPSAGGAPSAADALGSLPAPGVERSEAREKTLRDLLSPGRGDAAGEWRARVSLADGIEGARTPFRLAQDFQCSVQAGLVCSSVLVPSPDCFAVLEPRDEARRVRLAKRYALRTAAFVARTALSSAPGVTRACVNCHDERGRETRLSLSVDEASLGRIQGLVHAGGVEGALPHDDALRAWADEGSWEGVVEPFATLSDERFGMAGRWSFPGGIQTACPDGLMRATGARRVCDLGATDPLVVSWTKVARGIGDDPTTAELVSALVELQRRTDLPFVASACERTARALIDGEVEATDVSGVTDLFLLGTPIDRALFRLHAASLAESPDPETVRQLIATLKDQLDPIMAAGTYRDTDERVWRHFNHPHERICYNLADPDDGRPVAIVPESYFSAVRSLMAAHSMFDRHEEALVYADELFRLSPLGEDGALERASALARASRPLEAEGVIRETIPNAVSAYHLSACFKHLAFVEWMLGRGRTAVACYERAMRVCPGGTDSAEANLAELLAADSSLSRLDEGETAAELEGRGIPLGDPEAIQERLLGAVAACVDAGRFRTAAGVGRALFTGGSTDVLVSVVSSLVERSEDGVPEEG